MPVMVVVNRADTAMMWALLSLAWATNFSGATSTPRSTTSKPPPSSMAATSPLPISCRSPLTVPITTRPVGSTPLRGQLRTQQFQRPFHGPRGNQQFRHEVLVAFETPPDFVHGGNHLFGHHLLRIDARIQSRLGDLDGHFGISVQHGFIQSL